MSDGRFVVVRVGGERYGLPLGAVREVVDIVAPRAVPTSNAALRGVMPLRDRHCSLVHLAALLAAAPAPSELGDTAVVVDARGAPLALEVDDVEGVVDRGAVHVGAAPVAWATGVWRVGTDLVTTLDLDALAERVALRGTGDGAG